MDRQKIILGMALFLCFASPKGLRAQDATGRKEAGSPSSGSDWYAGAEGGVPFGFSTFSSFGADKTRAGYALGLFVGYCFNPVLSLDLAAKWGETALSARECCINSGYWLGSDGNRYYAPVADMEGHDYAALKSSVAMQRYGVQFNVNLLGLFRRTRQSRWRLELSPELSAVGTKAIVRTTADNTAVSHGSTKWHLGTGGNLQVGYALTHRLSVGVYTGILHLTGSHMDGVPEHPHKANIIWESGVRIGWTFGNGNRRKTSSDARPVVLTQPTITESERTVCPEETVPDTIVMPYATNGTPVETTDKAETEITGTEAKEELHLTFPTIYFAFNRTDIAPGEQPKLQTIFGILQDHPDVRIRITGWCDRVGSRAVNDRISLQRAEAVKNWLTGKGIDSERIQTVGKGIDYSEPNRSKARRAETGQQGKEEQP